MLQKTPTVAHRALLLDSEELLNVDPVVVFESICLNRMPVEARQHTGCCLASVFERSNNWRSRDLFGLSANVVGQLRTSRPGRRYWGLGLDKQDGDIKPGIFLRLCRKHREADLSLLQIYIYIRVEHLAFPWP